MPPAIVPAALALGGGLGGASLGGTLLGGVLGPTLAGIVGGGLGAGLGDVAGDVVTGQKISPLGVGISALGGGISGGLNAPAESAASAAGAGAPTAALSSAAPAASDPLVSGLGDTAINSDFAATLPNSPALFGAGMANPAFSGAQSAADTAGVLGSQEVPGFAAGTNQLLSDTGVPLTTVTGGALGPSSLGSGPSNAPGGASVPVGGASDLGGFNFTSPSGFGVPGTGATVPIGGPATAVPSLSSSPLGIGAGGGGGSAAGLASSTPGGGDITELLQQVQSNYGGPQGAGGSFLSNLTGKAGDLLGKNSTTLGLGALGVLGAPLLRMVAPNLVTPKMPYGGTLSAEANRLNSLSGPLISAESTGVLPPGQSVMVQQALNDNIASIKSKYAQMGLTGSTMEQQDINAAKNNAVSLSAQLASQATQTGLSEMGTANSLYTQLADYQLQQDAALQSSISNLAGSLGVGAGLASIAGNLG